MENLILFVTSGLESGSELTPFMLKKLLIAGAIIGMLLFIRKLQQEREKA